ncbi:MAG: response regulator [Mariprofundaceae bacterium]
MWFHIVEDEPELREVMCSLITIEGYRAASFKSAEAYLDFFNSPQYIKPVAIIIDNRMGGMSGIDLVRQIREHAPFQKLVIATATLMDIETTKSELCYELPKPFEYNQLKTMLQGLVACDKTYKADSACFEHDICAFGLEHLCPFAFAA